MVDIDMDDVKEAIVQFWVKLAALTEQEEQARTHLTSVIEEHRLNQAKLRILSHEHAAFLHEQGFPLISTNRSNDWPGYSVVYSEDKVFLASLRTIVQKKGAIYYLDKAGEELTPPHDVHVVWFGEYTPEEHEAFNRQRRYLDTEISSIEQQSE